MEKGSTLTLSLPCNTNKKLPMLLEKRNGIENGNGGVLHNGMSLFQDLKLKRRKVDSRCSSDGESIGTSESTSSLSPDAQQQGGEGSPKAEKERCLTPEDLVAPGPVSKSNGFPSQFFFMMKNESKNKPNSNNNNNYDSLKGTNGVKLTSAATVTTANVVVVKSEPGDDANNGRSTPSSPPCLEEQHRKSPLKRREGSPLKEAKSPSQQLSNGHMMNGSAMNGHQNGNGGSDTESIASVKSEKVVPDDDKRILENGDQNDRNDKMEHDDDIRMGGQSMSTSSSPRSMLSSASSTGSRGSPPRPHSNHNHHHQGMISSPPRRSPPQSGRENNPSTLIITKANKGESYSQRSSPMSHHSSSNSNGPSRGGSPPQILNPHVNHHLPPHMTSMMGGHHPPGLFHANQLHARLTENRREREGTQNGGSPMVHVEIRNLSDKNNSSEPPLSVVTSTSLSFQQGSMYRINGVRPEVISGGAVTPTVTGPGPGVNNSGPPQSMPSNHNNSHPQHHQQLIPNGTTNQHLHPHSMSNGNNGHAMSNGNLSITNHHLPFQGNRKSPSQLSRSPNSSPSNSSSSGSIQHSPGSTGSGGTIIAGGNIGMVNSSTNSNGTHHVNLSRTPTVIMGEAGGVRTMLWSQPGQPIPNPALEIGLGGSSPPGSGNSSISSGASSNGSASYGSHNGQSNATTGNNGNNHPAIQKGVLSMERLWASEALNLSTGASNTTNGHGHIPTSLANGHPTNNEDDDYEQPMICMICEDRATGLHYGIITCEGCKGFFKRTVQNRRVYTCVADGTCEITKAQRNRCQYCRFKKCIEQGMVLQAVREDRMPGGRNSGAVYNLYKVPVKYRKHKKGNRGAANGKGDKTTSNNSNASSNNPSPTTNIGNQNNTNNNSQSVGNNTNGLTSMLPPHPGNILMAALTSPNEGIPRRQHMPFDQAASMINSLVQCDNFHDIAALHNWEELLEARGDLSDKLCQMGDSIVYRLVQWTKRLPFYSELPVEVHTRVLTHKWHELLVLTTSAWHAMHSPPPPPGLTAEEETMENLQVLQRCLQAMMGRSLTLEQLKQDVGQMVERLTYLTRTFRRLGIRLEEYVSLKVIAMLQNTGTKANEVSQIQERYIKVLRTFLEMTVPSQPNRLTELLRCLPEVQAAASLLLESKMFYVPFLLNSALLQR